MSREILAALMIFLIRGQMDMCATATALNCLGKTGDLLTVKVAMRLLAC